MREANQVLLFVVLTIIVVLLLIVCDCPRRVAENLPAYPCLTPESGVWLAHSMER